jgi:acetyltransferase-like isoleucine patch superfamily enzyme
LYGHGGIEIEDTVIIGPHSLIAASSHIVGGKVECRFAGEMARGVRIGRNCWLGGRVTVLDGVVISEGAVIGAGSVVTRDVAAGCMVVGVPARPVRRVGLNPLYGCTTVE